MIRYMNLVVPEVLHVFTIALESVFVFWVSLDDELNVVLRRYVRYIRYDETQQKATSVRYVQ